MRCPIQACGDAGRLLAYCARRLDADAARLVERHIEHCSECGAFVDAQRAAWSALDVWEAVPVSPDFDRRLYQRIEREESAGFWNRVIRPWFPLNFRPALPLALASLMIAAAFLVHAPKPAPPKPPVETVDAEQVEQELEDLNMLKELPVLARVEPGNLRSM